MSETGKQQNGPAIGGSSGAWSRVRPVTASASVLLAPNPGPMTLEGTNTWVLRAPDADGSNAGGSDSRSPAVIVDPGPLTEEHLVAVAAAGPVELILLTHGHS